MNKTSTEQDAEGKFTTIKSDSTNENSTKFDPLLVTALDIGISDDNINETQSNITDFVASKEIFDNITGNDEKDKYDNGKFTLHLSFHRK